MDLFELNGRVVVDLADAMKAFNTVSQEGQKTQSKLSKVFSGVGKVAATTGKAIGAGLVAGGAAMGTLTVQALNLAGELEQNMGGSEQVFGKYAGKMQDTAKAAFSNMGLSTSEFLGTANKMGALFQGAGFSIEESMTLSSGAMQRAADVASIMGIDTSAAMEAIAGAAKGNFTMMDNLGVAMNDTTLQAYALEKGINKSTREMTNQEKIGLAMEMFMEKTAYAAGNYAKENETLAGSLGTAKSALTNFLDGSGDVDQLVTAFSNAANVIIDNLTTLAPRLISGITSLIDQIIPMLPPLLSKILPTIVWGATSLINGLITMLPELISTLLPSLIDGAISIAVKLAEMLPSIVRLIFEELPYLLSKALYESSNPIVSAFGSTLLDIGEVWREVILPALSLVGGALSNLWTACQPVIQVFADLLSPVTQGVQQFNLLGETGRLLETIFVAIADAINVAAGWIAEHSEQIRAAITTAVEAVQTVVATAADILTAAFQGISTFIENIVQGFKDMVQWGKEHETAVQMIAIAVGTLTAAIVAYNVAQAIKNAGGIVEIAQLAATAIGVGALTVAQTAQTVATTIGTAAMSAFGAVMSFVTSPITLVVVAIGALIAIGVLLYKNWDTICEYAKTAWEAIKTGVSNAVKAVGDAISKAWEAIKTATTNAWNAVKTAVINAWEAIKTGVSNAINAVKTTITNVWNAIKSACTTVWNGIKSTITNVWNGIKSGVSTAINAVKTTITNVFNGVKSTVTNIWNGIKTAIQTPIEKARDIVSGVIDKIKGFFDFKITWPKIPMPHFGIKPEGWKIGDLLKGSIPRLSIDWYAKAMNNPMIMDTPTIFGYNPATGSLLGGGEAGSEVVSGTDTLMRMINNVVAANNAVYSERIVTVLTAILEAITGGNREMIHALLSGQTIVLDNREFARAVRTYA